MYKDCLFNWFKSIYNMILICSDYNECFCDNINKIILLCFDDKCYVKLCGVEILVYGYSDIEIFWNFIELLNEWFLMWIDISLFLIFVYVYNKNEINIFK